MIYCKKCGVELHPNSKRCPLCRSQELVSSEAELGEIEDFPQINRPFQLKLKFKRGAAFLITLFIAVIPLLLTLTADIFTNGTLTWSRYSALTIIFSALFISTFWFRRLAPLFIFVFQPLLIFLFVAGVGIFAGSTYWILPVALPIIFSVYFFILMNFIYFRQCKVRNLNIIAFLLITVALFCMSLDLNLQLVFAKTYLPVWSLYVAFTLIPLACLLFYIQYGLKKEIPFRRFFHI